MKTNELFVKQKKSRHTKAVVFTVLFHVLLVGGLWLATADEDTTLKSKLNTWIENINGSSAEVEDRP